MLIDLDGPSPRDPDAAPEAVVSRPLGRRTNNFAEWTAVILALERATAIGAREVELVLDSKLVVEQLMGRWRVKEPSLVPLHARARTLLDSLERWTAHHEGRASNRAADALANLALDDPGAAARAEVVGWVPEADATAGSEATEDLDRWMAGYLSAWRSNDPDEIGALFTDDAVYRPTPFSDGWRGRAAIVAGWLDRLDEPGSWTFQWEPLGMLFDTAVIRGRTTYQPPESDYENLWFVRLGPDGRCTHFTEWWMEHPSAVGAVHAPGDW